jgi:hypothetical protein
MAAIAGTVIAVRARNAIKIMASLEDQHARS